jgi:hypothetical protein
MAIKASFGNLKFDRLEGYRIATHWSPHMGFQGHFYVYVWERLDATTKIASPVELEPESKAPRDKLQIADEFRTYVFDNIDFSSVEVGANRRERFRLTEFRYNPEMIDFASSCPVDVDYKGDKHKLLRGNLENDYTYALEGSLEQLLGFTALLSPSASNVIRFSTIRNSGNCFLKKILELNQQRAVGETRVSDYAIKFSQGKSGSVDVTQENVLRVYTEENFGHMAEIRGRALTDFVSLANEAHQAPELARLSIRGLTDAQLLAMDSERMFRTANINQHTVETATYVFRPGEHVNLKIS